MKLPKGWKTLSLGTILEQPESGVSVLCEDGGPRSDEPGVLKLSCVTGGHFNPNDRKKPMANEVPRLTTFAKRNTILISRSNTPALVGASAYVKCEAPFAFLPDTLWMLHPKEHSIADVSMKWLSCLLLSDAHRLALQRIASGTSDSMKKIQKGALLKLKVPVPPLPEQRKIADILSTWDESLEKLDALIAAKERCKKGLMQQLLTGKRRVKGAAAWKVTRLSEVAEERIARNQDNFDRSRLYAVTKAEGMVPMRERVQGATVERCKVVEMGWFAYNPMRINIGSIARWEGTDPVMVSGDYVVFSTDEKRLLSDYLNHIRRSSAWCGFVGASGNGSVRIRIWFDDLGHFKFPLPPVNEQRSIADILDTCDNELRLLRAQRAAIDRQKRGLMQRLLIGKIRVNI